MTKLTTISEVLTVLAEQLAARCGALQEHSCSQEKYRYFTGPDGEFLKPGTPEYYVAETAFNAKRAAKERAEKAKAAYRARKVKGLSGLAAYEGKFWISPQGQFHPVLKSEWGEHTQSVARVTGGKFKDDNLAAPMRAGWVRGEMGPVKANGVHINLHTFHPLRAALPAIQKAFAPHAQVLRGHVVGIEHGGAGLGKYHKASFTTVAFGTPEDITRRPEQDQRYDPCGAPLGGSFEFDEQLAEAPSQQRLRDESGPISAQRGWKFFAKQLLDQSGKRVGRLEYAVHPKKGVRVTHVASDEPGGGRKLMLHAVRAAARLNAPLDVAALPRAEGFYARLGLRPTHADRYLQHYGAEPSEVQCLAAKRLRAA